jgi:hypothetical protein
VKSFYRRSLEIDFPIEVMSLCTARYAEVGVAEVSQCYHNLLFADEIQPPFANLIDWRSCNFFHDLREGNCKWLR